MREASNRRTVTDTVSRAFLCSSLIAKEGRPAAFEPIMKNLFWGHMVRENCKSSGLFRFFDSGCDFISCKLHEGMLLYVLSACLIVLSSGCSEDKDDYEIYSTIHGTVSDYVTGVPIENASITLSPSSRTAISSPAGEFSFDNLDSQQYTLTVQKNGYQPNRKTVVAISGERTEVNVTLTPIPE